MKFPLFISLLVFSSTQGAAQNDSRGNKSMEDTIVEINSIVKKAAGSFMKDPTQVGLSIGIIKDGVTFSFHFGTTEKGRDLLPTDNTIYELGSVSKTFTGTLLAHAVIDGKLNLEDDIRKYLPDSYSNLQCNGHPIKIMHLANHTSGLPLLLPELSGLFQYPEDSMPSVITRLYRNYTLDSFWSDLHKIEIKNEPGYNVNYSNAGAQLAGFILARAYNRPFRSLLKEYITKRLKMTHTDVTFKENRIEEFFAKGYNSKGTTMPYNHTLSILQPAGGICSSVKGMLKYIKMHLNEKNAAVNLCHRATLINGKFSPSGLFCEIDKSAGHDLMIWHSGATFGFSSYWAVYPGRNFGIILMSNEYDRYSLQKLTYVANSIVKQVLK